MTSFPAAMRRLAMASTLNALSTPTDEAKWLNAGIGSRHHIAGPEGTDTRNPGTQTYNLGSSHAPARRAADSRPRTGAASRRRALCRSSPICRVDVDLLSAGVRRAQPLAPRAVRGNLAFLRRRPPRPAAADPERIRAGTGRARPGQRSRAAGSPRAARPLAGGALA